VAARIRTEVERSCGGVIFRASPEGVEICLIATRGGTRWQLPKGHLADGETEAEAARREVREETGCAGDLDGDLGEIVFWFFVGAGGERRRVRKSVHFFLLRYTGGETKDHDAEVDDARWWPASDAIRELTFDSERDILVKAIASLRERDHAAPRS
jgi:8-oxo-dGTP pyrophosphatase MutT (NUDIX family)